MVTIVGQDTVKINGRIMSNLADDAGTLAFANSIVKIKTGLNGNNTYALDESGKQCTLALSIIRGSSDDVFLNRLYSLMKADFASFTLLTGEIVKRIGDGQGNILEDTYILKGGVFTKEVGVKTSTSGVAEQPVVVWNFLFTEAPRVIG
jgi:hypothetical protein